MEILNEIRSLNLQDKLLPSRNPEITWFYLFFPALIAYLVFLTQYINEKPVIGYLESFSPEFDKLFPKGSKIEIISSNNSWSEGPIWIEDDSLGYLLYSDTIQNRIFKWEEGKGFFTVGKSIFSQNIGCFSDPDHCSKIFEPGPNGILRIPQEKSSQTNVELLICQHGERAISVLHENGTQQLVVTHFKGKRLNSPNDLILSPEGDLIFTDPMYGLYHENGSHALPSDLGFSGVFMLPSSLLLTSLESGLPAPALKLLISNLTHPNGLAFSPDYSKLYVSNSDRGNAVWMVFDLNDGNKGLSNGRVFFNATDLSGPGAPDGFKVDIHGNLFASGPDGLLVLDPDGQLLGRLRVGKSVSNIAFGADGRLYLTCGDSVARVKVNSKPNRVMRSG